MTNFDEARFEARLFGCAKKRRSLKMIVPKLVTVTPKKIFTCSFLVVAVFDVVVIPTTRSRE